MNSMFRFALSLALCSAFALTTACQQSEKAAAPGKASLGGGGQPVEFIPVGMDFVLRADIATLAQTMPDKEKAKQNFQKMLDAQGGDAVSIFKTLGLDPFEDIHSVALGARIDLANPDAGDIVAALKSTLTSDAVVAALKKEAPEEFTIKSFSKDGAKGHEIKPKYGDADEALYMVDSDNVLLIASNPDVIAQALAAKKSGQTAFKSGKTADGLKELDAASQVAFYLDASNIPRDPHGIGAMPGTDDIKSVLGSYKHSEPRHNLAVSVRFGDPKNAAALTEQLQGLMNILAMDPNMAALFGKISIGALATDMRIGLSLTNEEIEEIEKAFQQTF